MRKDVCNAIQGEGMSKAVAKNYLFDTPLAPVGISINEDTRIDDYRGTERHTRASWRRCEDKIST